MIKDIDNKEFEEIIQSVSQKYGEDISLFDRFFVLKAIEKRVTKKDQNSYLSYLQTILDNPGEAQKFLSSLNINYSEFFRNSLTFSLLGKLILPFVLSKKEKTGDDGIRIWSASCAAGQEAFSIAMLLDELLSDKAKNLKYHIFATDKNEKLIRFAKRGSYDFEDVKKVTLNHITKYFKKENDRYVITGKLKENINFSVYNLLDEKTSCPPESIYGDFDIIFCCNILFYYNSIIQKVIIDKITECLPVGGYFVTGEAEKSIIEKINCFTAVTCTDSIFKKIK